MKILAFPLTCRLPLAALLLAGVAIAPRVVAEPTPSEAPTPTVSSPPPAPVSDNSSSQNSSSSYSSSYDSSYSRPSYSDSSWPRDSTTSRSTVDPVLPIFYPPTPPVLGAPIPLSNSSRFAPSAYSAPAELQDHVGEFFYPALGTRLLQKTIKPRLQARIEAYRTAKAELQNELRHRIADLRDADPATRRAELAAFAKIQTPRIAALEKSAEELRQTLIEGDFFQGSVDWNSTRSWRLGKSQFRTAGDALSAQHQVMRGAAFYQDGLLPEQRGLLREIAIELQETVARGGRTPEGIAPPLFFSPATSRFRLPPDLPAELAEKIARYEQEKSAIKQELRDAVYAQDKTYFTSSRSRLLESLGDRQWPRLATLEDLAEEIRVGLERLPEPVGPPPLPMISTSLSMRIATYMADKKAFETEIVAKVTELKQEYGVQRVSRGASVGEIRLMVGPGPKHDEQLAALREALVALNLQFSERRAIMLKEVAAIRDTLEREAPQADGRSPEAFMQSYSEALRLREEWVPYADYQAAMLTPGLSPEQRRLLYAGGVQQLELPLPGWERTRVNVIAR